MALLLDTASAIRGTTDRRALVDTVVAAGEHDEADWLEWKSKLDLTTKDGCFPIARTILGMANRLPERASSNCEGLGYLVVGAEPGSLEGVASVDPARLDQLIEPYLGGAEGARWTPTYVVQGEATVLVITVEAQVPGDPIFTLRKEFQRYLSGTVFVRKQGRTVQADAADMDALQRHLTTRGRSASVSLELRAIGDVPLSWFAGETTEDSIAQWVDRRRNELIAHAEAAE